MRLRWPQVVAGVRSEVCLRSGSHRTYGLGCRLRCNLGRAGSHRRELSRRKVI